MTATIRIASAMFTAIRVRADHGAIEPGAGEEAAAERRVGGDLAGVRARARTGASEGASCSPRATAAAAERSSVSCSAPVVRRGSTSV